MGVRAAMCQKRRRCKRCAGGTRGSALAHRRSSCERGAMAATVDVFWSFRSPYSYLATPRLVQLAAEWTVDLRVRVVLPLAVRKPDFFATVNPLWPPYLLRDTWRIAEYYGIPYG